MTAIGGFRIDEVLDAQDMDAALAIRHEVFCVEQGVAKDEEFDGRDGQSRHYLAWLDGVPAGAARTRPLGAAEAKIERVAVLAALRRRGIGRALMERAIEDLACSGVSRIVIHAQCHAESFYVSLGFVAEGEVFEEAGIPHVRMVRTI